MSDRSRLDRASPRTACLALLLAACGPLGIGSDQDDGDLGVRFAGLDFAASIDAALMEDDLSAIPDLASEDLLPPRDLAMPDLAMTPDIANPSCGSAACPDWTVMPLVVDFGLVNMGMAAPPKTVTLKRAGMNAGTVQAVRITGQNANDFRTHEDFPAPITLSPGVMIPYEIRFYPQAPGRRTACLVITVQNNCAIQVPLEGTI